MFDTITLSSCKLAYPTIVVTAQQQPQPQQQNSQNCSWSVVTAQQQPQPKEQNYQTYSLVETKQSPT